VVVIDAKNVKLSYGESVVIQDISMQVPKGGFVSVIGPNGCGKSTFLKAISRNLKPASGEVFIEGKSVRSYDTRVLSRKMAFLAQSPHVPEQFSVRELVSYGRFPYTHWLGTLRPHDYDIIDWAMEMTETTKFAEREMVHLSGGERQRVWIAMALAQEADILLLDEPTTYLDIAHQFQTLELIYRLHREMKKTVLMVLHDLNQAARYSEKLFVMKQGDLVAEGPPADIIREDILRQVFSIDTKVIWDDVNDCPYFIPLRGIEAGKL
jgi:iron complex transport system ATP-binding protein